MLNNAYLVAKIGADTAENEQHFAEILPIGRRVLVSSSSFPVSSCPSCPRFLSSFPVSSSIIPRRALVTALGCRDAGLRRLLFELNGLGTRCSLFSRIILFVFLDCTSIASRGKERNLCKLATICQICHEEGR